jgi:pimeloyl-ACP methyl ester carboxylesterase
VASVIAAAGTCANGDNPGVVLPRDEAGSGPAVLLLHAGIADRRMWHGLLDPLADAGRRVIAVDMPGFGDAPLGDPDAPWRDVLETLDELGVEQALVAGNSFGGLVAQRIVVEAPGRVSALMLVSSPFAPVEPSAELQAAWQAEEAALTRGDVDAAVAAMLETWVPGDAPAALRGGVEQMQRRAFELQLPAYDGDDVEQDELEVDAAMLEEIAVPALVAAGEHDMPYFHDAARALALALGAAEPVTIEGAAHLAPLEAPDRFCELLLSLPA